MVMFAKHIILIRDTSPIGKSLLDTPLPLIFLYPQIQSASKVIRLRTSQNSLLSWRVSPPCQKVLRIGVRMVAIFTTYYNCSPAVQGALPISNGFLQALVKYGAGL